MTHPWLVQSSQIPEHFIHNVQGQIFGKIMSKMHSVFFGKNFHHQNVYLLYITLYINIHEDSQK